MHSQRNKTRFKMPNQAQKWFHWIQYTKEQHLQSGSRNSEACASRFLKDWRILPHRLAKWFSTDKYSLVNFSVIKTCPWNHWQTLLFDYTDNFPTGWNKCCDQFKWTSWYHSLLNSMTLLYSFNNANHMANDFLFANTCESSIFFNNMYWI